MTIVKMHAPLASEWFVLVPCACSLWFHYDVTVTSLLILHRASWITVLHRIYRGINGIPRFVQSRYDIRSHWQIPSYTPSSLSVSAILIMRPSVYITPARQASKRFTYRGWLEDEVDLAVGYIPRQSPIQLVTGPGVKQLRWPISNR